jgi:hypothetical protein
MLILNSGTQPYYFRFNWVVLMISSIWADCRKDGDMQAQHSTQHISDENKGLKWGPLHWNMKCPVFTRLQLVHTVTKHTDFTKAFFTSKCHAVSRQTLSFTTARKVRPSLRRFSRKSYMSNSNMRRSLDTELHPNRTINAVSTDRIHLRRLSLCRFSRNSKSLNTLLWKSCILIFSNRIKN